MHSVEWRDSRELPSEIRSVRGDIRHAHTSLVGYIMNRIAATGSICSANGNGDAKLASVEAEWMVAAAFTVAPSADREALDRAQALLGTDGHQFAHRDLGLVYAAAARIRARGEQPDPITVWEELKASGHAEEIGGLDRIAELTDIPTCAHVEDHARIVVEKHQLRQIRSATREALREINQGKNPTGILQAQRTRLDALEAMGLQDKPLFDPDEASVRRFLSHEPPAREWLITDVLPADVVGVLAGAGGMGKSLMAWQLATSLATGLPFLGMPIASRGGTLLLFAEDPEDELHRRTWLVLNHYAAMQGSNQDLPDRVAQHVHAVSRVGEDNLLTTRVQGVDGVKPTSLVPRLIRTAQQIRDLRLIVVDSVSRFRGGNANAEEDATRFVQTLEAIRMATGATVLGIAHTNQDGRRRGGDAEMVRGSTALPDGVRWVATAQQLRRDGAKQLGISADDAAMYVRLEVPKANYSAPVRGMWLHREPGGVFVPIDLEGAGRGGKNADANYRKVVTALQDLLRTHGAMSRTSIETNYAGVRGPLGAGQKKVREVIDRAVQSGDLVERPNPGRGGGTVVDVP